MNKMEQGMLDIALPQLGAAMAKGGQGFANAGTMSSIRDRVAEMSPSEQERFFNMVSSGNLQHIFVTYCVSSKENEVQKCVQGVGSLDP